jgi:hypothetical protein
MKNDELIDLHFGLGLSIRNAFGLHDDSKLLLDSVTVYPRNPVPKHGPGN